ncbi:MAG: hypothetical protein LBP35_05885 [Candidatus Ancillula trichonymphae]|jgi:hypothetical protein|nr:hypothetical protein [Candidatus Ancillula trichonymphae]
MKLNVRKLKMAGIQLVSVFLVVYLVHLAFFKTSQSAGEESGLLENQCDSHNAANASASKYYASSKVVFAGATTGTQSATTMMKLLESLDPRIQ